MQRDPSHAARPISMDLGDSTAARPAALVLLVLLVACADDVATDRDEASAQAGPADLDAR